MSGGNESPAAVIVDKDGNFVTFDQEGNPYSLRVSSPDMQDKLAAILTELRISNKHLSKISGMDVVVDDVKVSI